MDAFFEFAGDYWWLVFPLVFGVFPAVGGWLSTASKRRHKRKLELIKARSEAKARELEAKAKQLEARGGTRKRGLVRASDDGEGGTEAQAREDLLERLWADHDAITQRWLDYELDIAKQIAFPSMSDGRQPLTAAFLRAQKKADALRPATLKALKSDEDLAEYLDAVGDYAVAFDVAERDARRVRDTGFSGPERERLAKAQQLLKVAVDSGATPAERQVAYKRVRAELDGLISLSDAAVQNLEARVAQPLPPAKP